MENKKKPFPDQADFFKRMAGLTAADDIPEDMMEAVALVARLAAAAEFEAMKRSGRLTLH